MKNVNVVSPPSDFLRYANAGRQDNVENIYIRNARITPGDQRICKKGFTKGISFGKRLLIVNFYFKIGCFTTAFINLSTFAATLAVFLVAVERKILKNLATQMMCNLCTTNISGKKQHK